MEEIFDQFGRLILETVQHYIVFFIENHHSQHKKNLVPEAPSEEEVFFGLAQVGQWRNLDECGRFCPD